MFTPPFCPRRGCRNHTTPAPGFCIRYGSFHPKCRPRPVPRFRCRGCRRTFSRQTFRVDYRDHKPHLNTRLFELLTSGVGLRQSSRTLGLSMGCTELKFRKLARHLRRLNLRLRAQLPAKAQLHLDEFETFEGQRNARPLSVPLLIESESRYLIWAESAPIRPRGKMTKKRLAAIREDESRHGPRRDTSRRSLARALARGAEVCRDAAVVVLNTDEKSSYARLAAEAFGRERLVHHRTNSKLVRATWNPLFPINHEEAMARDLMGRMRRESWLVSQKRRYLDLGLQMHMAFRNLVRKRFNHDEESPAQRLGFVRRRLTLGEVLSWSQSWGLRSPLPDAAQPAIAA